MTNFSDMLTKAKAMQEKMKDAQEQIKKIEVEGVSGGDLVKVLLTGDYELKSIGEIEKINLSLRPFGYKLIEGSQKNTIVISKLF